MSAPPFTALEARIASRLSRGVSVLRDLHWGHWLFAGLSLLITLGASWSFASAEDARAERRFEGEIDRTVDLVTDRLQRYEDLLWASVAKIAATEGRLTRTDWQLFAQRLANPGDYPAVTGSAVGFAVPADELPRFIAEQRLSRPGFNVWPEGQADVHLILTYVQSEETQGRLEGLDASQDPARAKTILRAAQRNQMRITKPLATDGSGELDVVLLAPFYDQGNVPETLSRRQELAGWTGLSIRVRKLIEGVLAENRRDIRIRISDGEAVLYDEGDALGYEADPTRTLALDIPVYGRTWKLHARAATEFTQEFDGTTAWFVFAIGLLIDALAFWLLVSLSRTKRRAERSAQQITGSLQTIEASFEEVNGELHSLAHIISYDLQLPLRDIGMLVDRLRSDLAGSLDEGARRDVKSNLIRINHITSRATAVITGVLKYSNIQALGELPVRCHIGDVLAQVAQALDIDEDRLHQEGEVRVLKIRRACLELVLGHLISNAFAHHPDPAHANVSVSVERHESVIRFCVKDDGIGIDPAHHDRIFDLLQTVRPNAASEGVGVGLSIVRKIVERCGGKVSVRSALGKGASFVIDWPPDDPEIDARVAQDAGMAAPGIADLPKAA